MKILTSKDQEKALEEIKKSGTQLRAEMKSEF